MAALLHEPAPRASLSKRLQALHPESSRQWGTMSPDQMLWHVNAALRTALGELPVRSTANLLTRSVIRWCALHAPWPRGRTPTYDEIRARGRYDFSTEQRLLRELMNSFAARPLRGPWPPHPTFGRMNGSQWSRLMYRHLDYHLCQFGV